MSILADRQPLLRIKTRPNDANSTGEIFGGWLMSQIDIAGSLLAVERSKGPVATIAVKQLRFLKPIYIYDLVSFYGEITHIGNTSITVEVEVFASRTIYGRDAETIKVSDATIVYVAISKPGQKRTVPK